MIIETKLDGSSAPRLTMFEMDVLINGIGGIDCCASGCVYSSWRRHIGGTCEITANDQIFSISLSLVEKGMIESADAMVNLTEAGMKVWKEAQYPIRSRERLNKRFNSNVFREIITDTFEGCNFINDDNYSSVQIWMFVFRDDHDMIRRFEERIEEKSDVMYTE